MGNTCKYVKCILRTDYILDAVQIQWHVFHLSKPAHWKSTRKKTDFIETSRCRVCADISLFSTFRSHVLMSSTLGKIMKKHMVTCCRQLSCWLESNIQTVIFNISKCSIIIWYSACILHALIFYMHLLISYIPWYSTWLQASMIHKIHMYFRLLLQALNVNDITLNSRHFSE